MNDQKNDILLNSNFPNQNQYRNSNEIKIENELKNEIYKEIDFKQDKDIIIKKLEEKLKNSLKKQEEYKKKIESTNERLSKQNKILDLFKNNENKNNKKLKEYKDEMTKLSEEIERMNAMKEGNHKKNEDIVTRNLEVVSGSLFKLGEIIWDMRTENYVTKAENIWLEKERMKQYNGDF